MLYFTLSGNALMVYQCFTSLTCDLKLNHQVTGWQHENRDGTDLVPRIEENRVPFRFGHRRLWVFSGVGALIRAAKFA